MRMSAENRTQWYQDVDHDLSSPGKTRPAYISKYDDNLDDGKDLGMGAPRVRYMVVCSDESCILVTKTDQVKFVIRWHLSHCLLQRRDRRYRPPARLL